MELPPLQSSKGLNQFISSLNQSGQGWDEGLDLWTLSKFILPSALLQPVFISKHDCRLSAALQVFRVLIHCPLCWDVRDVVQHRLMEALKPELCRPQPSVAQQQEIEDFWQNTWFGQKSEGLGGEKRRKNPLICPGFAAHQLFGRTITAALLFSASCAEALGNSWSMAGPEALYYTFRVFWDCLKAASWLHMLRMQNTLRREAGQMLNSQLSTWRSSWDMTSRHR